jgi:hypothetical protein
MEASEILKSWGLSDEAIALLTYRPNLVRHLGRIRQETPFPVDYRPRCHELLYEDLVYVRISEGSSPYLRPCSGDYRPAFWEVALDGQTGLFMIGDEVVVDRTVNLDPQAIKARLFDLAGVAHA